MLKIDNISKQYSNKFWAVKDFSLEINCGEIVCIAGPNGSGKTTIMNCILGVISTTKGKITYNDLPNTSLEYKRKVSYVPDDLILINALTGEEHISFVKSLYGNISEKKVEMLIDLFNMKKYLRKPIATYSNGMKKKVQIINAFMLDCSAIVLDEPFRCLDIESGIILKRYMKKFTSNGSSILLSTHDLISAEAISDRVSIIADGKKLDEGCLLELKEKYHADNLEDVFFKVAFLSERSKKIDTIINNI